MTQTDQYRKDLELRAEHHRRELFRAARDLTSTSSAVTSLARQVAPSPLRWLNLISATVVAGFAIVQFRRGVIPRPVILIGALIDVVRLWGMHRGTADTPKRLRDDGGAASSDSSHGTR